MVVLIVRDVLNCCPELCRWRVCRRTRKEEEERTWRSALVTRTISSRSTFLLLSPLPCSPLPSLPLPPASSHLPTLHPSSPSLLRPRGSCHTPLRCTPLRPASHPLHLAPCSPGSNPLPLPPSSTLRTVSWTTSHPTPESCRPAARPGR